MKDDSASYYDSQEFKDLLETYETMLNEGGNAYFDSMDLASIAEYYTLSGELDKSDAAIEFGLVQHPMDPDILIAKSCNLLQRGQTDQARVISESITETDNQELMYLKGCIELASSNSTGADFYFQKAATMSDSDPGMYNDIIVKFMDNHEYELCQQWLDEALILDPDSRNFIELQADLYFDTGQTDNAIAVYDHLLDEFPFDSYYWEQMGRIYYEKGDYAKARECFEYIEAIDTDNKSARMMKASCIFSLEQWDQAFDIYSQLLAQDPDSYTLLYYCGRCLFEAGRYEHALPYFQKSFESLSSEQDDEIPTEMLVELFAYMCHCAYHMGNTQLTLSYLTDGLALNPEDSMLLEIKEKIGI